MERLINEIPGMDNLRGDRIIQLAALDVNKPLPRKTLNVGDPLLVLMRGYQAGFDAWNDEWNQRINEGMAKKAAAESSKPAFWRTAHWRLPMANRLLQAQGSQGSFLSDGQMLALQETEDGSVRLSPKAMAVLDEELGKQEQPLRPHILV